VREGKIVCKKEAMNKFMTWLTSDKITKNTNIPFPDEARAFAGVYDLNKKLYKTTFEKINSNQPQLP
jgi:hypothetical protein